jgi:hypothetical protein
MRGNFIQNSRIYDCLAEQLGFSKTDERRRPINAAKRYLPITSKSNTLETRMRQKIIQIYRA